MAPRRGAAAFRRHATGEKEPTFRRRKCPLTQLVTYRTLQDPASRSSRFRQASPSAVRQLRRPCRPFRETAQPCNPGPPRIWRLRPAIYRSVMPRLGEKITGLANGLNVLDGPEIKDYAAPYFLDEAATAPLLGNAKKIAAALVGPSSRDKTFKELVKADAPPSSQLVEESIALAFRKIIGRSPSAEETARFQAFHAKATTTGGHVTAGKALLTAVLLQPEVLYRSELGEGEPDEHGRARLSQRVKSPMPSPTRSATCP